MVKKAIETNENPEVARDEIGPAEPGAPGENAGSAEQYPDANQKQAAAMIVKKAVKETETIESLLMTADDWTKKHGWNGMSSAAHVTYGERTRLNALSAANEFAIELAKTGRGLMDEAAVGKRFDAYLKLLRGE